MSIQHMESLQPALAELERALQWVSQDLGEFPFHLVPVIQTQGRKSKCAGWFSPDQWSTREGDMVHEITFCAEDLNADPVDIISTARHEIVHLWCLQLELKDVSTGGRHNKVFKEQAELADLVCAKPFDSYGHGYTTPTDEFKKRIEKEFKPDVSAFNLFRLVKPSTAKKVKTNAWICKCDKLTLRIPAKQKLDATCHKCDTKFVPKEDTPVVELPPVDPPKKVKAHKHKDGLPEHDENVPFHEHKEGEGHIYSLPEPELNSDVPDEIHMDEAMSEEETIQHDAEMTEAADEAAMTTHRALALVAQADGFDHYHSEFYANHRHRSGAEIEFVNDAYEPEEGDIVHGYEGEDYESGVHSEDAMELLPPADSPVDTPPKKAKKSKKSTKDTIKKTAKK